MASRKLLHVGPFEGVTFSSDPYYLPNGAGLQASNVDISYRYGAFATAKGRTLLGTLGIPTGYTVQGIAQFSTFYGDNPVTVKRLYVFSAVSGTSSYQGYFDPATGATTQFPYARPFTQAVQFGAALWTNGGDRISYLSGALVSDVWQISVPYQYAYNVTGTYATTAGSAPVDTYTYAITLRKAQNPWPTSGSTPTTYYPDLESLQESSPVFSTSVSVTTGQQPGFTVPSTLGLANLISGLTIGGQQYYGCLYRSRNLNPTYTFVDYLTNLTQMNDHAGNASIIDTYSDSQIINNSYLTVHRDTPPIIGQTYPGAVANNSSAQKLQQSTQQVSFTYTNPCFIAKHKSRMWAFTLYPTEAVGNGPILTPDELTLQPQLWCSNYGTPWEFNDDGAFNQVLLVGPEDTPGNGNIDSSIITNAPWAPGILEDTPMGIASTGSYLVLFKSQRADILTGDTPSEFIVQQGFDIGCMSSFSITEAEGGIFWLAPQGVYFFSGGAPAYISEGVRGFIESLTWAELQASVGSYRDRTYYLSFATANTTLAYYLPSKKWYTLPYGAQLSVSSSFNANSLIFVNGNELQQVAVNVTTDLGSPIVATWQTGTTDSGAESQLKTCRYLTLVAAVQPGTVAVTVTLDANAAISNTVTVTFDLSKGNGAHCASLPQQMRGYEATITIVATTSSAATAPIQIRAVSLFGDVDAALTAPPTTDMDSMYLNGKQVYP